MILSEIIVIEGGLEHATVKWIHCGKLERGRLDVTSIKELGLLEGRDRFQREVIVYAPNDLLREPIGLALVQSIIEVVNEARIDGQSVRTNRQRRATQLHPLKHGACGHDPAEVGGVIAVVLPVKVSEGRERQIGGGLIDDGQSPASRVLAIFEVAVEYVERVAIVIVRGDS